MGVNWFAGTRGYVPIVHPSGAARGVPYLRISRGVAACQTLSKAYESSCLYDDREGLSMEHFSCPDFRGNVQLFIVTFTTEVAAQKRSLLARRRIQPHKEYPRRARWHRPDWELPAA